MTFDAFVNFNGNCKEAVEYYAKVFKLDVPKMMTYGEAPREDLKEIDRDRILYTNLKIGSNNIMFSDCPSDMEYIMGNNIAFTIGSSDAKEVEFLYNSLKEGGEVFMPLEETFFSKLYGMLMDKFGIIWQISLSETEGKLPSSGKAKHKWTKEVSEIEFIAKSDNAYGKAIWRKRDELVLLSGAKLEERPQLNKDGSLNYSARFAEKLRLDNENEIDSNTTIEDIVFKSPNELGLFLFYGGQNTWLELKDSNGKSLDEWSRID